MQLARQINGNFRPQWSASGGHQLCPHQTHLADAPDFRRTAPARRVFGQNLVKLAASSHIVASSLQCERFDGLTGAPPDEFGDYLAPGALPQRRILQKGRTPQDKFHPAAVPWHFLRWHPVEVDEPTADRVHEWGVVTESVEVVSHAVAVRSRRHPTGCRSWREIMKERPAGDRRACASSSIVVVPKVVSSVQCTS